jgi:hypothetical protein
MAALPDPVAGEGVVTHDPVTRSLLVKAKPGDRAWRYWRQGHQVLLAGGGYGGRDVPAIYASGASRGDVARGEAVADGWLRFKIRDAAAYRELVGGPLPSAIVTVDRAAGCILAVKFRGR